MAILLIKSVGFEVLFETDFQPAINFFTTTNFPKIFIPGFTVKMVQGDHFNMKEESVHIKYIFSNNPSIQINHRETEITIYDDWSSKIPTYILALIYSIFLKVYVKHNLFSLHSSSVQGNNANFLFIGKAGSGKTTTVLELAPKHGYKFLSNNKTIIDLNDEVSIKTGTQAISTREIIPKYLKFFIDPPVQKIYGRSVFTFRKDFVGHYDNRLKTNLIKLQINSGVKEFKKMDFDESMIFLYPNLLDLDDRELLLFNWSQPSPLKPPSIGDKLRAIKAARRIYKTSGIYHLSGSIEFICSTINALDKNHE